MPYAIGMNLVIAEKSGKSSQVSAWIPSTTTLVNAQNACKVFAQLLDPVHEGACILASITLPVSLAGVTLRAAPLDGSSVGEGAMFAYRTPSNFKTSFRVPCINEGIYNPDRSVDLLDAGVVALNNAMVGGLDLTLVGGTGSVNPCNISDDDISALRFVKESNQYARR